MWIIGWFIVGLIAGGIARLIMPGRDPMGCLATGLLGMAGGVLGGWIGSLLWPNPERRFIHPGLLLSIVGAVILLALWRLVRPRTL
ncbi:MAG TPA: GlsB/YeaQ/YmgE family stress response membrane protein [Blastocatellia bacterium]|nr:GlsB/YeaQ/YmgE family stress response membrane protein [Blastocatellia bacterium]